MSQFQQHHVGGMCFSAEYSMNYSTISKSMINFHSLLTVHTLDWLNVLWNANERFTIVFLGWCWTRPFSVVSCTFSDSSLSKVGRSKPPPVLTSGFNRLKPPRSISQKVVNTGQYESEWSIENSNRRFCGGLRYLYSFIFYLLKKEKKYYFVPAKGTSISRP